MGPLSGAALILGFVLLQQRRVRGCIAACALQGWAVALAVAWQGWVQAKPELYLAAAATLAVNGMLLPRAIARIAERPEPLSATAPGLSTSASVLLGLLLIVVAVLAMRPAIQAGGLMREDLAAALAVALLGLSVTIAGCNPLLHAVGFLSLGNGLILGVAAAPGMPMAMQLAFAVLAMGALAVLGFSFRVRGRYG